MTVLHFFSQPTPAADRLQQLAALQPENPFATACWIDAERQGSGRPYLLGVRQADNLVAGCIGFMRQGRLSRTLSIPSLPLVPDEFWPGLVHFCRTKSVSVLRVNTFASPALIIPPVAREMDRYPRFEYVLSLDGTDEDLLSRLSMTHRQRVRKGAKAGLRARVSNGLGHLGDHVRLMAASFQRREARGESIAIESSIDALSPFMISGACVLYQAMLGNDVVSSMTVARSRLGRYLHTSGTSPAGMSVGASHFLIYEIARSAQAEGANRFNLGGARDRDCGLAKFKEHFGAECIELESADFFVGNAVDRALHSLLGGTRGFLATFARAAKR